MPYQKTSLLLLACFIFLFSCKTIAVHDDTSTADLPDDIELIKIPAGNYSSGRPATIATIDYDFAMMKYPVTNTQYINYLITADSMGIISIDSTGVFGFYNGDKFWAPGIYQLADFTDKFARNGYYPPDIYFTKWRYVDNRKEYYYDHPVTHVTWYGAQAFASFYNMRLPTTAEWEKAARANSYFIYPWGNTLFTNVSNYKNSGDPYDNDTTPVWYFSGKNNTKENISPYGLMDMSGNTWEWTDSWWRDSSGKVIKGGSFNSLVHSTVNDSIFGHELMTWYETAIGYIPDNFTQDIGFRCVKDISD